MVTCLSATFQMTVRKKIEKSLDDDLSLPSQQRLGGVLALGKVNC
jgi:hypothetical protein